MRIVLVTGAALEVVHTQEIQEVFEATPAPGVIEWNDQVFIFAYRENPFSLVYRDTFKLQLP